MTTSLMNWPEEYDAFLMTHMALLRRSWQNLIKKEYQNINTIFNEKNRLLGISEGDFFAQRSVVESRAISTICPENVPVWFDEKGGCLNLFPVFDLFNHGERPNAKFYYSQFALTVIATEDIEKKEEIRIHYGAWKPKDGTNQKSLEHYGLGSRYIFPSSL